ncbi:MAG TPA: pyridoxal phosphate-dependent aminotransferase [Pyrinomonadaceae bacterium]|nr:pyridoxal phosphate-dependent aminotransferase [Pyrinomonadaceae bacterium]
MKPVAEHLKTRQSEYMHWAKTRSDAKFNLATSGLANLRLTDLEFSVSELELTGLDSYGYKPLIQELSRRYRVDPKGIVTAAGTSFANHLAMAALIDPGDEVLIERPTYEPILALAQYLGAKVQRFERNYRDGFGIQPGEIGKVISERTRLVVLTNFHNPSGVSVDESSLREVGEIARKAGAHVLVDEVYREMLFEVSPTSAFHLGPEFVVTSSLTKAYGLSGLRCGWIFAAESLAERMWRLNDLFAATPVHAGERLSVIALRQLDRLTTFARARLDTNRVMLNQFLDSRNDLEAIRPESGSIMFPRVKSGKAEELFELLREKYETSVVPGRFFEMPDHFRIGMGGDPKLFVEGLERLGAALEHFK